MLDAVSSKCSLSVLLSAVETSLTYVRVPCIVAVDTIGGWRLFSSELLIVQLVFEGGNYSRAVSIKKIYGNCLGGSINCIGSHPPQILQLMNSHKRVRPCVEAVSVHVKTI